ncbi:MAG: UDP-N-acetylmuramoyl-tripeptide--D-alanyl-D-alanine ligase [Actinomycetota bacterium]|nr:UDP-N-acetylmuramoyl-tripeptide--D-alanyl-D-alanine ligase [Actinomycetota bacterium]
MRGWSAQRMAEAARGDVVRAAPGGPERAVVDSRAAGPGDLFVGLPGARVDGGRFAGRALDAGAWGVLVAPEHAAGLEEGQGAILTASDPLGALQRLATAWRRALAAQVVGVTGSTGKTSTKDVLRAMLAPQRRVVATEENLNTEIGLPLTVLGAPAGTEVLVLEMAMRGAGQIAELARIAEPDVGVVTNVGPVHLELLGTVERVAAAKAELLAGLRAGATAVLPAGEPLLDPHLRADLTTVTFGPGGDVEDLGAVELAHASAHMRLNALAALAAARALGVEPRGRLDVRLSALRGQRLELPHRVLVIDDCYNANPMSVRAALDDLAATAAARGGRRLAVLGDMLELGPGERRFHEEAGARAREDGVDVLVAVGSRAAHMVAPFGGEAHPVPDAARAAALVPRLVRPGDTVLVKGSRGVGLEVVGEALRDAGVPA